MSGFSKQKNILDNINGDETELVSIPKPVLTSNDKKVKKPADTVTEQDFITLTIVVTAQRVDDAEN